MTRIALWALLPFLLPCCGGCIFPYCAYPTLDYTPNVKLEAPPGEVHAFRVDISRSSAGMGVFKGPALETFAELPVSNTDEAPAQFNSSFTYGFVIIGVALNYLTFHDHSVALRLYRPGYELVEIKTWELSSRVEWKRAPGIDTQEKALDSLFPPDQMEKGSVTLAHREALLFGVKEYERLAAITTSVEQTKQLLQKASTLKDRADDTGWAKVN